jgi:hypothetical protein
MSIVDTGRRTYDEWRALALDADKRASTAEAENVRLRAALEAAIERLNGAADIVSEWSGTTPDVYTVSDFLGEEES